MRAAAACALLLVLLLSACGGGVEQGVAGQEPQAPPFDLDGPGRYYVFRTLPHRPRQPTSEQLRRCYAHFGLVGGLLTSFVQTNAVSFAFSSDPGSGLVSGETATYLGPGFICARPALNADYTEAYAYASIPGAGDIDAQGSCLISPQLQGGSTPAAFVGCRMALQPKTGVNVAGGLAVSNTVSGSIFTAYVVPAQPGTELPAAAPPPRIPDDEIGALPNDPDFWVLRSFDETLPAGSGDCAAGETPRLLALSPVEADPQTSRLNPWQPLRRVASAQLCLGAASGTRRSAAATLDLLRQGAPLRVEASGDCDYVDTPAGAQFLQQACVLRFVRASDPAVTGGLLTISGLVQAQAPLVPANSQVWTLSLLPPAP